MNLCRFSALVVALAPALLASAGGPPASAAAGFTSTMTNQGSSLCAATPGS